MMDVLIRVRATYPNADKSEGINSLRGTCNAEEWSASRLIRARAHLITLGISRVAKHGSGSFVNCTLDFGRFGRLGGHAPMRTFYEVFNMIWSSPGGPTMIGF